MSLLKQLFTRVRKEQQRISRRPPPKPKKPEPPTSKGMREWLRRQRPGQRVTNSPALLSRYAAKRGWVTRGLITHEGMLAAWAWAVEFSWRGDRGIWEGLCAHGVGHPLYINKPIEGIHGCDRCCNEEIK